MPAPIRSAKIEKKIHFIYFFKSHNNSPIRLNRNVGSSEKFASNFLIIAITCNDRVQQQMLGRRNPEDRRNRLESSHSRPASTPPPWLGCRGTEIILPVNLLKFLSKHYF